MQYTLKQKRNITLLLALVPFLMGIGIDLYVPSLPAIAHDYQVDNTLVQLTISIYMLGYALGQIFLGVISDSLGRKKVILFSGVFYTLISLLSAYSSDISILILLRFLQGIGIAGLGVVARAIATDCFQDLDLTKAMATFSLSWALGPILGPFIGGYIQDYFNWQVDFYLFAVYGGVISIFIAMTLPETQHEVVSMNFSNILQRFKMILLDPIFLLGSLVASLAYSVLVIFNVIGPFLVQDILKYSAIDYGRFALILGMGYFLGNSFNRFIIHYVQPAIVVRSALLGSLIMSIAMLAAALFFKVQLWIILMPVTVIIFLCGLILPNTVSMCVSLYPKVGGTTNAIVGCLTAAGVFFMTSLSSLFKTQTQIPMAILYLTIAVGSIILFFMINQLREKNAFK